MQKALLISFSEDIAWMRVRLAETFSRESAVTLSDPMEQLIGSILSCATRDEVSRAAHRRLRAAFPDLDDLGDAPYASVLALIGDVTHPESAARYILLTLREVRRYHPGYRLDFLDAFTVDQAHAWLERFCGVGPKIAAAVLSFSTLDKDTFVADRHVLRVFERYGLIGRGDAWRACEVVVGAMSDWHGGDFRDFHWQVKRLGQQVCTATVARCGICPLTERCLKRRPRGRR